MSKLAKPPITKQNDQAFVLHTSPWRETSLLCEVFTKNYGRLIFSAKGARSAKSLMRGQIMAFHKLDLHWRGKGDIPTISKVDWIGEIGFLNKSSLIAGYYLNELILNLLHRGDGHEYLFELYDATICALYAHPNDTQSDRFFIENCLRRFEVLLIREIGYGLRFANVVDSDEVVKESQNYLFELGVGVHLDNADVNNKELVNISGKALLKLESFARPDINIENNEIDIQLDRQVLQEQKKLLRAIINQTLLPKTINSRALMSTLVGLKKV